jgi:hypothetical protein
MFIVNSAKHMGMADKVGRNDHSENCNHTK